MSWGRGGALLTAASGAAYDDLYRYRADQQTRRVSPENRTGA